jgi:hypothetical protein
MARILLLLLAFESVATVTNAQRPTLVTICAPTGHNQTNTTTYTSLTVASTELTKYPGYVKGTCAKNCPILCTDFPSFNATGIQCRCNSVQCGLNAKVTSNK